MQTGLQALRWGPVRLGIGTGAAVLCAVFAYITLVLVLIALQAVSSFGQG
jgi:hypothetical protein